MSSRVRFGVSSDSESVTHKRPDVGDGSAGRERAPSVGWRCLITCHGRARHGVFRRPHLAHRWLRRRSANSECSSLQPIGSWSAPRGQVSDRYETVAILSPHATEGTSSRSRHTQSPGCHDGDGPGTPRGPPVPGLAASGCREGSQSVARVGEQGRARHGAGGRYQDALEPVGGRRARPQHASVSRRKPAPRRRPSPAARASRALLPADSAWKTEVPLPIPGDQRAWDATTELWRLRVGIEAETGPSDLQAPNDDWH